MKLTLEFDSISEREEFEDAFNGTSYRRVLYELDQELRKVLKYENPPENGQPEQLLVYNTRQESYLSIRTFLRTLLDDLNINL